MSLRARLLTGVLVMTAVGLFAAGGGTYLALRSFLLGRVDQQLMAARASVGRGLRQSTTKTIDTKVLDQLAPPVAFVEVRDSSGRVVAVHNSSSLSGSAPGPRLPAVIHLRRVSGVRVPSREPALQFDVAAVRGAGRYRVLVSALPSGAGLLIVAVALDDVSATLHHLLVVELLIAAVLLAVLAAATFWLLRRALRPLERISEIAGGIAQGDLDVRLSRPMRAVRSVGWGSRSTACLNGLRTRSPGGIAPRRSCGGLSQAHRMSCERH